MEENSDTCIKRAKTINYNKFVSKIKRVLVDPDENIDTNFINDDLPNFVNCFLETEVHSDTHVVENIVCMVLQLFEQKFFLFSNYSISLVVKLVASQESSFYENLYAKQKNNAIKFINSENMIKIINKLQSSIEEENLKKLVSMVQIIKVIDPVSLHKISISEDFFVSLLNSNNEILINLLRLLITEIDNIKLFEKYCDIIKSKANSLQSYAKLYIQFINSDVNADSQLVSRLIDISDENDLDSFYDYAIKTQFILRKYYNRAALIGANSILERIITKNHNFVIEQIKESKEFTDEYAEFISYAVRFASISEKNIIFDVLIKANCPSLTQAIISWKPQEITNEQYVTMIKNNIYSSIIILNDTLYYSDEVFNILCKQLFEEGINAELPCKIISNSQTIINLPESFFSVLENDKTISCIKDIVAHITTESKQKLYIFYINDQFIPNQVNLINLLNGNNKNELFELLSQNNFYASNILSKSASAENIKMCLSIGTDAALDSAALMLENIKVEFTEKEILKYFPLISEGNRYAFNLLLKMPISLAEYQLLSPPIEIKSDWLSLLCIDFPLLFLYRMHVIEQLLNKQGFIDIFDKTRGAEIAITAAALTNTLFSSDKDSGIVFKAATSVLRLIPNVTQKIDVNYFRGLRMKTQFECEFANEIAKSRKDVGYLFLKKLPFLIFGNEYQRELAISLVSASPHPSVGDILINYASEAFEKNNVEWLKAVEASISFAMPSHLRDGLIENFLKYYRPERRLGFLQRSSEFTSSLFRVMRSVFAKCDDIPQIDVLFHDLISEVLLAPVAIYDVSDELTALLMDLLDRFADLTERALPILELARENISDQKSKEISNHKIEEKKITNYSDLLLQLAMGEAFDVIESYKDCVGWKLDLQMLLARIKYLPVSEIDSSEFAKNFDGESQLSILKKISDEFGFVFDTMKGTPVAEIEGHTISIVNKSKSFEMSYKVELEIEQEIKNMITSKTVKDPNFMKLYSRMEAEMTNEKFSLQRLIEIFSEPNDVIRVRSIISKCCDRCHSSIAFAEATVDLDHNKFIFSESKIVRQGYAQLMKAAFEKTHSSRLHQILLTLLQNSISNDSNTNEWQKGEGLCNAIAATILPEDINQATNAVNIITKYIQQLEDIDGAYEHADLSGLFEALSNLFNTPNLLVDHIQGLIDLPVFNGLMKGRKHVLAYVRLIKHAIVVGSIPGEGCQSSLIDIGDILFSALKSDSVVASSVAGRFFAVALSLNDSKYCDLVSNYITTKCASYTATALQEMRTLAAPLNREIESGLFSHLDKWIDLFMLNKGQDVRNAFVSLMWAFINSNNQTRSECLEKVYHSLISSLPRIAALDRKTINSITSENTDNVSLKDALPEQEFFRFLRGIIKTGSLRELVFQDSEFLGKMIYEFSKITSTANIPRTHLIYFIYKVIPVKDGHRFFAQTDWGKIVSSLENLSFESIMLTPSATIIISTLSRAPRGMVSIILQNSKLLRPMTRICLSSEFPGAAELSILLQEKCTKDDKPFFKALFDSNTFNVHLKYSSINYFKLCRSILSKYKETSEYADKCWDSLWSILKYRIVNMGRDSSLYSAPKLPTEAVLAKLAGIAAELIFAYPEALHGRKSIFGKDYSEEFTKRILSLKLNSNYIIKKAVEFGQSGYFDLSFSVSQLTSRAIDISGILKRTPKEYRLNAASFIKKYSEFAGKHLTLELIKNEFLSVPELYDDICKCLARFDLSGQKEIAEHLNAAIQLIENLSEFGPGFTCLCTVLSNGSLLSIEPLVRKARNMMLTLSKQTIKGPIELTDCLKCALNGAHFILATLSSAVHFEGKEFAKMIAEGNSSRIPLTVQYAEMLQSALAV